MSFRIRNLTQLKRDRISDMQCEIYIPSERTSPWLWVANRDAASGAPGVMVLAMYGASYLNIEPYTAANVSTNLHDGYIRWLATVNEASANNTNYDHATPDTSIARGSTATGIWVFPVTSPSPATEIRIMTYYSTIGIPLRGVEYKISKTGSMKPELVDDHTENVTANIGLGDYDSQFITLVRDLRGPDNIATIIGFNDGGDADLIFLKLRKRDNTWYRLGGFRCHTPPDTKIGWMPSGAFFDGVYGFALLERGGDILKVITTTTVDIEHTHPSGGGGDYNILSVSDSTQSPLVRSSSIPMGGRIASSASISQDMSTIFVVFLPQIPTNKLCFAITAHRKSSLAISGGTYTPYYHIATFDFESAQNTLITAAYPVTPPTFVAWTPNSVTTGDGRSAFLTITTAQAVAAKLHSQSHEVAAVPDANLLWNRSIVVSFDSTPAKAQYLEQVSSTTLQVRNTYISPSFMSADMSPTEAALEVSYITGDIQYNNVLGYKLRGFDAFSGVVYRVNPKFDERWIPKWLWGGPIGSPTVTNQTTIELMPTDILHPAI